MNTYSSVCIKWILFSLSMISVVSIVDDNSKNGATPRNLRGGVKLCKGYKKIPFAVTNIAADNIGDGKVQYNFYTRDEGNKLFFLKDVIHCDAGWSSPYELTGTSLSASDFKDEVQNYMDSNDLDHVLYNIHGFDNEPLVPYEHAWNWDQKYSKDYLVIPIQWRNVWEGGSATYTYDRKNNAPRMGKLLAKSFSLFEADYDTSIMCHSQGNFVFRVFAQNVKNPSKVFVNFFSVAADARMDMFSSDFNPLADTASDSDAITLYEDNNKPLSEELELDPDELMKNGGYAISELATRSHVIWNKEDKALIVREHSKAFWGDKYNYKIRQALGRFGDSEVETAPYFNDKVTFHDLSDIIVETFGNEHSYQWTEDLRKLYIQYKTPATDSANKQKISISPS